MAIRMWSWSNGQLVESTDVDELGRLVAAKGSRTWIDLTHPRPELVQAVARRLGLHHLVAEDIIEKNERAKIELVGDAVHLVAFRMDRPGADAVGAVEARGGVQAGAQAGVRAGVQAEVQAHEVDFVLGRGFVLSVHGPGWDPMTAHQVRMGIGPLLEKGVDHVLWAMVDQIVDGYFPVFDRISDEIDAVQDRVLDRPDPATLEQVFRLRRELVRMRHVIAPSREAFAQLTSREFALVGEQSVFYFRDVYDHLIRLSEELDTHRELIGGTLDVYLSTVNNNLSAIMKRLTGVTVILAGIGAIGGLFGMSEAASAISGQEGAGFYMVAAATVVGAVLAVFVLRRIDWL